MTGGIEFWLAVHSSNPRLATSALGQKQTSEHDWIMSALPPIADIGTHSRDVCFVPKADSCSAANVAYSITSSAETTSEDGMLMPSALAVVRLITVSNFVGACTGKSAGFSPLRIRST